jgi:KGK domain
MNNQNNSIQISEIDVISFVESVPLSLSQTVKFTEFIEKLKTRALNYEIDQSLINEGVECELLQPGSQGWKKGKIKIRFEFVPDDITHLSELDEFREETWPPQDPTT